MSSDIVITSIVCVTIVGIVCIFAILAYFKDNAFLDIRIVQKIRVMKFQLLLIMIKIKDSKN